MVAFPRPTQTEPSRLQRSPAALHALAALHSARTTGAVTGRIYPHRAAIVTAGQLPTRHRSATFPTRSSLCQSKLAATPTPALPRKHPEETATTRAGLPVTQRTAGRPPAPHNAWSSSREDEPANASRPPAPPPAPSLQTTPHRVPRRSPRRLAHPGAERLLPAAEVRSLRWRWAPSHGRERPPQSRGCGTSCGHERRRVVGADGGKISPHHRTAASAARPALSQSFVPQSGPAGAALLASQPHPRAPSQPLSHLGAREEAGLPAPQRGTTAAARGCSRTRGGRAARPPPVIQNAQGLRSAA